MSHACQTLIELDSLIIRVLGSDFHVSLTLRVYHVVIVPTSLSIGLRLRCNPEAAVGVASRELAQALLLVRVLGHATWAMEISHTGPGLCLIVLVRVELGIAILRATVLRTPSTGWHCFFKIRLSKCRGLQTTRFHAPTLCKHVSYLPRPYRQIGRANGAIIPTNNGRAGQTQSRFRTAWCRHLYMATMASPVPVRSASIADGPLACFSQTHSQLYWPSPVCSSARSTRSAPSAVVTGDDEFQFLRRMTTHPNSTIAAEVLFEIAAQTASSCLSHEPLRQAQIQCSLGKENRHPPVTTGLRMPSVLLFQPTPSK